LRASTEKTMGCAISSDTKFKATKVTMTPENKTILTRNGWDKGIVGFGFAASEASCVAAIALVIAGKKDVQWVNVSFDDAEFADVPEEMDDIMKYPNSTKIIGVKDPVYKTLCGGSPQVPTIAINGQLYQESTEIVKMLADEIDAPMSVKNLIDQAIGFNETMLNTVKHWGWCAMHKAQDYAMVNKGHYLDYGEGNKDEQWERVTTNEVKAFFSYLESLLENKTEINGYFIGQSMTLADAALFNVVQSLELIAGLNVKGYYPKLYENWEILKASNPEGSAAYLNVFPGFAEYVTQANAEGRAKGFDINTYWAREASQKVPEETAQPVKEATPAPNESDDESVEV